MKFVSYNVQYGRGKDGRYDLARIARALEGADVIALQEVERFWKRSGMVDQVEALAALLPDHHWVYGPGLDLDTVVPGASGRTAHRRRQFGNMLLARAPILSSRHHMLPKYGTLTQYSLQRSTIEGVVATRTGALRVYSVHLTHLADESRAPQVDALLALHARAPAEGGAWCGQHVEEWTENQPPPAMPRDAVLMGDFNLVPTSPLYARIVGPLSPEYGRMNGLEGFVDAWVAAGHREDDGITNPDPRGGGKRIDYCFVSSALRPLIRRAWIDDQAPGSDHQPIWTEIDV